MINLTGLVLLLVAYFFPTIIAALMGAKNIGIVFLTNLIAGWTVAGWFVVLFQVIFYRQSYELDDTLTPHEHRPIAPDPALARPHTLYPKIANSSGKAH